MKAAILTVGTEILFGEITNTNTVYLSRRLNDIGIDVMYHYTVGDNPGRLAEMIETSLRDCDIVITTGGLGPTQDDMTKEIACQVMGDELVMHDDILEGIRSRMLAYKAVMTDNNIKQALLPSRCRVFYNDAGTAPGFALDRKVCEDGSGSDRRQWIACLPGPPKEMTRMFERSVTPWLEELTEGCLVYKEIRTFGIGDARKYAMGVLDAVLGRGMSSRLFMEVREKRGLGYDISSQMHFFRDAGLFTVAMGTDPAKASRALATIDRTLAAVREKKVGARELGRVKEFLTGNFRISHENVKSKMFFYGSTWLSFGRLIPPSEQVEGIKSVTADEILAVAKAVFRPENRSLSLVVPEGAQSRKSRAGSNAAPAFRN